MKSVFDADAAAGEIFSTMPSATVSSSRKSFVVFKTELPFWRARKYVQQKKALLECVLRWGRCTLEYSEDPVEDGMIGVWNSTGPQLWRIPTDVDAAQVHDWLHLGNWMIYDQAASLSADERSHIWQGIVDGVEFGVPTELSFAVLSFHDNDPWWILLSTHRANEC